MENFWLKTRMGNRYPPFFMQVNFLSKAISIGYLLSETFSPDNFKEKYVIHHFFYKKFFD